MSRVDKLSEVDLHLAIEGSEGVDRNYSSRIRSQFLIAQHQTLVTQAQFADAKAAAILALLGIVALRGPIDLAIDIRTANTLVLVYMALVALTTVFCLLSIIPRYPGRKRRNQGADVERWSWPSLASDFLLQSDFGQYMQTSEVSHLIYSLAHANQAHAQVLLVKFRMLRIAFVLLLAIVAIIGVHAAYSLAG
jgi:hypothetical protein